MTVPPKKPTKTAPPKKKMPSKTLELEKQLEEMQDKLLRTAAEAQNVRRIAEQDIKKARDYAIESFAKDMTTILEHLYRASDAITEEAAAQNESLKNVKDGVELTKKELINALEKQEIKRIYPLGEAFNHDFHQAMQQVADESKESGTVLQVIQAGYTLKDRLLNPALVIVAQ